MASCPFADGIDRILEVLGGDSSVPKEVWDAIRMSNTQTVDDDVSKILAFMARNTGPESDDAVSGVHRLLRVASSDEARGRALKNVFLSGQITDDQAVRKFLSQLKRVVDGLGGTRDAQRKNLTRLLDAMHDRNALKGTWYSLEFVERGGLFRPNQVKQFEVPAAPGSGIQGVDLELEPGNSPRFFELKSGKSISVGQGERHIRAVMSQHGADAWKEFRFVINAGKDSDAFKGQVTDWTNKLWGDKHDPNFGLANADDILRDVMGLGPNDPTPSWWNLDAIDLKTQHPAIYEDIKDRVASRFFVSFERDFTGDLAVP